MGLTCEELFLVVRGRLEDPTGGDGRVVQHCKESSQWHWHRAGDGTKEKCLHSVDKALPLNSALPMEGAGRQAGGGRVEI